MRFIDPIRKFRDLDYNEQNAVMDAYEAALRDLQDAIDRHFVLLVGIGKDDCQPNTGSTNCRYIKTARRKAWNRRKYVMGDQLTIDRPARGAVA